MFYDKKLKQAKQKKYLAGPAKGGWGGGRGAGGGGGEFNDLLIVEDSFIYI